MSKYYFSISLEQNRTLCLTPLTNRIIAMSGEDLRDTSGYFLYERVGESESADISILAQIHDEEAVFRLRDFFGMN